MFKRVLIILPIIALVFFSANVHAQVRDTDVTIELSPELPAPHQEVKAYLKTYVTDLNKAYITWSVNNIIKSAGVGKTEFSFNTGGEQVIHLSTRVETATGQNLIKNISIPLAQVDLLWEATNSFAPPFYKGKTLVEKEGSLKVVAIPWITSEGKRVHSANLSYVWTKDGRKEPSHSGWGNDSFIFKNSYLDVNNRVKVVVSDILGVANTQAEISLFPSVPKIIFYEKDPILGVKTERSLKDGFFVDKDGTTIVAYPYHATPENIQAPELEWEWIIGGVSMGTPIIKNEMSVRPESGKSGVTSVKTIIRNSKALFSGAEKEINARF